MRLVKFFVCILVLVLLIVFGINLEVSGYVYHNDFNASNYKIHGIDISHHQIRINWNKVDKRYKFVIMKATEGKDFLDGDFLYNWNKAQLSGFKVGAYHFFTMTSKGKEQALYYISKVPNIPSSFPPIVDVEVPSYYPRKEVIYELKSMINTLEQHYGKKVIIYIDYKSYNKYIKGALLSNPLWIRDIRRIPNLGSEDNRWIMWQYSNRGRVKGIDGFTDKNVLRKNDIEWYINLK